MSKIQLEKCQILAHRTFAGAQRILTLASQKIPILVKAGQFVYIEVGGNVLMRRPMSIMLTDIENNTFDLLYKIVGAGTDELANRQIGEWLSVLGPIGNGFTMSNQKLPLLIGGGVGMPPMIAIAQQIKDNNYYNPFVILGSEVPFPFDIVKSKMAPKDSFSATMLLLENWGVACRLASLQAFESVFQGYVTELAKKYLDNLSNDELSQVEIYSCGPEPMLAAVATLAKEYKLPAQLSLEEYMACAVGGCAGCAVRIKKNQQESMQKVCVDGPVFMAENVFYD